MREKILGPLFVAFFSLILLLVADRALGWLSFPEEKPLPLAHARNSTLQKNDLEFNYTIRTNRLGIRYPEIPLRKKPEKEFRVAVLGDSFTEGMGVEAEHTFPALLEKKFSGGPKKVLFINCGLIGAGPAAYARILLQVAMRYDPDRVLLVLYANDLADTQALSPEELRTGQGWLVPRTTLKRDIEKRTPLRTLVHTLLPRIYTMGMEVKEKLKKTPPKDLVADVTREAHEKNIPQEKIDAWTRSLPPELVQAANKERFDGYLLAHGLVHPNIWQESLDIEGEPAQQKWRTMAAILDKMAAWCKARGIPLGIVYAPGPFQYDPVYASPSAAVGTVFRKEWLTEESELEKRLAGWAAGSGLPFLNLTPHFRESAAKAPGTLNFKLDPHWTPAGNNVAADAIQEWLKREKLAP